MWYEVISTRFEKDLKGLRGIVYTGNGWFKKREKKGNGYIPNVEECLCDGARIRTCKTYTF